MSNTKKKKIKIEDSIKKLKKFKKRFDQTVDMSINLNINTKNQDQNIKGVLFLPNFIYKNLKILVFSKNYEIEDIDKSNNISIYNKIDFNEIKSIISKFDKVIATPEIMPAVSKLGKLLGPKNLMPNPKFGTVTTNVKKTIEEINKGKIEYKNDKYGIIHLRIGKISFSEEKILENFNFAIEEINRQKPKKIKNKLIKSVFISLTMSKSYKIITK